MTIDQLNHIGQLLYGTQWQSDLARALNIDSRRVRGWLKAERPLPDWLGGELKKLLIDNISQSQDALTCLAGE